MGLSISQYRTKLALWVQGVNGQADANHPIDNVWNMLKSVR